MTQSDIDLIKTSGALNGLAAAFNSIIWDARKEAEKLSIGGKDALSILANLECKLTNLRQLHSEYAALSASQ